MSSIKTLFTDSANTNAIYPRTKLNAVSDADGNTLGNVSLMTSTEVASGISVPTIGVNLDLLWTNQNPTSDFGAQTLNIDLSDYCFATIVFKKFKTSNMTKCENILINGTTQQSLMTEGNFICQRSYTINTNGIEFNVGQKISTYGSGPVTENGFFIPLKIYGIKGVINE